MRIFQIFLLLLVLSSCRTQKKAKSSTEEPKSASTNAVPEVMEQFVGVERGESPLWVRDEQGDYHPEPERTFRLHHTKLELVPVWEEQSLLGKATLTLEPWFYAQNKVVLDAKGFKIKRILIDEQVVTEFQYDGKRLTIPLTKVAQAEKKIELVIEYVARPLDLMEGETHLEIRETGIYFINPEEEIPNKPRQIWTQGETQNNSCWFPTFDQPNQKSTQEVILTVDTVFETLSNGALISSKINDDGTRTDHWKQDLPHAPYLFMLAIGDFTVVKDRWKDLELSYYVEHPYKAHVEAIFGRTPEMIAFFSEKFGYNYPWEKYAQVVVRDFISGAMENTSATVHMIEVQQTTQENLDANWDDMIAHEIVHHWFGDLVTCESWANLPLNEAFASYGEFLWQEHKYGVEEAHYLWEEQLENYLYEAKFKREPLIRYRYSDREDMFDSHSYEKGSLTLHLLRQLSGDEAFFASLKLFLERHAYKSAEIHDLRLTFEEVTGQDWNWFFEQYFLRAGHPVVSVEQSYEAGELQFSVRQLQPEPFSPIYRLPIQIDVWVKGEKQSFQYTLQKSVENFSFPLTETPELVIFDAKHQIIGELRHQKSIDDYLKQLDYATDYRDLHQALSQLGYQMDEDECIASAVFPLFDHPFWGVRESAVQAFQNWADIESPDYEIARSKLKKLARTDPRPDVRWAALDVLSTFGNMDDFIFEEALQDSSYSVQQSALFALSLRNGKDAEPYFVAKESENSDGIVLALADFFSAFDIPNKTKWFLEKMQQRSGNRLSYLMSYFAAYMIRQPEADQRLAADFFILHARENSHIETRKEAYQHLLLLEDLDDIKETIKQIRATEKDHRVREFHQALGTF
ncbi:MAG: M1 family aminopeptidase [Bacteroidota bacterium]